MIAQHAVAASRIRQELADIERIQVGLRCLLSDENRE